MSYRAARSWTWIPIFLLTALEVLAGSPSLSWAFTFQPAGVLAPGSGTGLKTSKVYAPNIRYPIEKAPSFPNSQVWGVGGSQGPKGSQCDAKNFSYPWWDNYCETRTWSMPLCPSGKGHQGQDIRGGSCANKTWWAVATEDGTITSIGTYSVYLKGSSGTLFRYLHMDPPSLAVKLGQKVSKGQKMGLVSNAFGGTPTSVHLHFDVEQYVAGIGTVFVSPYNSLVQSYQQLVTPTDPCATKNCDDSEVCTKDICAGGVCSHTASSGACSDGNACTLQDSCANSQCQPGPPKPCDDGNPCTSDSCSNGNCAFAPNTNLCDDGNACTTKDACSGGACQPGQAKDCSDSVACTQDTCSGGTCSHAPKSGTCDDGDPCTADSCDATGCLHVKNGCDDGNGCTADACNNASCSHAPKAGPCDDGSACTIADACVAGKCAGAPKQCEDENPCTLDACIQGSCTYQPVAATCDDGDGCTSGDYCALGKCMAGAPAACDDGLDCTQDGCVDGQCQHEGQVQAEVRNCLDATTIELYDICGAGPTLIECPTESPCASGTCGGVPPQDPDASGADVASGIDVDDGSGTVPLPTSPQATPSGCRASVGGDSRASSESVGLVLGLLSLVAATLLRRRAGGRDRGYR